jgi:hypothetical protein
MASKRKASAMATPVVASEEPVDPADELTFLCLGGGNEVGRSCHIIQYKGKTVMVSALTLSFLVIFCVSFYVSFSLSCARTLTYSLTHSISLPLSLAHSLSHIHTHSYMYTFSLTLLPTLSRTHACIALSEKSEQVKGAG